MDYVEMGHFGLPEAYVGFREAVPRKENLMTWTNIRIYSYPKNDTNKYPNKYSDQKYLNIWIFIYIRHTLVQTTLKHFPRV